MIALFGRAQLEPDEEDEDAEDDDGAASSYISVSESHKRQLIEIASVGTVECADNGQFACGKSGFHRRENGKESV